MRILDALSADFGSSWIAAADAILKATLIFAIAGIVSFGLRRRSAAVRHMVWTLALASVLVVPALSLVLPRWQLNLVTIDSRSLPAATLREAQGGSEQTRATSFQRPASS